MADFVPLSGGPGESRESRESQGPKETKRRRPRLASLDVFRGLSIALMIFVDYGGSILPFIAHSPWNGVHLADFVMPFFLFIAGISLSLVYKITPNKGQATWNASLRATKLFLLGIILQGGYFHGVNSLTFGVDIDKVRWLGILQRIAIGYIVAALCEIWSSSLLWKDVGNGFFWKYFLNWVVIFSLSGIYAGLSYGLYVPDWQFKVQQTSLVCHSDDCSFQTVKCGVRGDLGPACNAAGMIDRYVLGIEHLYKKPVYRNLEVCKSYKNSQASNEPPSWCLAPSEPEGILSSLTAAVTCIIGLHFGHILVQLEDHKDRISRWLFFSLSIFALALGLSFAGIPLNKSLYTISYMLLTTASAGFTFCVLYLVVDVYGYRSPTFILEWMGRHSLSIFVLVASNIAIIVIQGFYWRKPQNNIVHWVISLVHS
ncbi:heparan-alpha-glucosaminide N-acetyltransferase protein [Dioscorea alata]|uniref:Heparan-alpha-glucosaminide N-acetyltransferase protein n=3 Tax=Dioscorea alata TaxID=55571 RepID=A0ACB7WUP9_DIOAL|nr:heparan-alpha-glucosaminide N-acetyltransferase protein [Dioscorea alata]